MRMISYTVPKDCDGLCVGTILKSHMMLSSSLIARIKFIEGGILLNGKQVHTNGKAMTGDVLCVAIGMSASTVTKTDAGRFPYEILFEDEDILIINKPNGAAAHGSRYDPDIPSIADNVAALYGNAEMYHPVNRLDKGTTGVMVIAKNGYTHQKLINELHTAEFRRVYIGIAEGTLEAGLKTICLPIGRMDGSAIKREVRADGAKAVTHYSVLANSDSYSLVCFELGTGRTHQIRVHMSEIGHPLVRDWLYGNENHAFITRPALHSAAIKLKHPLSGEWLTVAAGLPNDMKMLSDKLNIDLNGVPSVCSLLGLFDR